MIGVEGPSRAAVGRHPERVSHGFASDPRLTIPAIREIVASGAPEWVRHNKANLPLLLPNADPGRMPLADLPLLDGNGDVDSWIAIWGVERAQALRSLPGETIAGMRARLGGREGRLHDANFAILVSAKHARVPIHVDDYHNVLLQIRGEKTFLVGQYDDVDATDRETGARHLHVGQNPATAPRRVARFHLRPGDGVYVPPYVPHWTVGGDDISVALSCTFHSAESRRRTRVLLANNKIRARGRLPVPAGLSRPRDTAKAAAVAAWHRIRGIDL